MHRGHWPAPLPHPHHSYHWSCAETSLWYSPFLQLACNFLVVRLREVPSLAQVAGAAVPEMRVWWLESEAGVALNQCWAWQPSGCRGAWCSSLLSCRDLFCRGRAGPRAASSYCYRPTWFGGFGALAAPSAGHLTGWGSDRLDSDPAGLRRRRCQGEGRCRKPLMRAGGRRCPWYHQRRHQRRSAFRIVIFWCSFFLNYDSKIFIERCKKLNILFKILCNWIWIQPTTEYAECIIGYYIEHYSALIFAKLIQLNLFI